MTEAPRYLLRDRDASYGLAFRDRLRVMGIKEDDQLFYVLYCLRNYNTLLLNDTFAPADQEQRVCFDTTDCSANASVGHRRQTYH
jgi:hypothetical protein